MASELRVNTLKDASGNNSVATSVVFNGTAKAWINLDGTGTISTNDSYNTGSITDNGTGDYSITITNDMANALYSYTFGERVSNNNSPQLSSAAGSGNEPAAGSIRIQAVKTGNTVIDTDQACITIHGDLA